MLMSLPVITPGACALPLSLLYTSMICPISVPVVYTSGAGMSLRGPMISAISNANRLVIRSFSPALRFSFLGLTYTPPLPPPKGTSTNGALPCHPGRQGHDLPLHVLGASLGVKVPNASLVGAAVVVVLAAKADKDAQPAVVHLDGDLYAKDAGWYGQIVPRSLIRDAEYVACIVDLLRCIVKRIVVDHASAPWAPVISDPTRSRALPGRRGMRPSGWETSGMMAGGCAAPWLRLPSPSPSAARARLRVPAGAGRKGGLSSGPCGRGHSPA